MTVDFFIVLAVFAAGLFVTGVVLITGIILDVRIRRRRFEQIFGFAPPLKLDGEEVIRLLQPDVDRMLRGYAESLRRFEQNRDNGSPEEKLARMRESREVWRSFSRACETARSFGFRIKETHHEYLPNWGQTR